MNNRIIDKIYKYSLEIIDSLDKKKIVIDDIYKMISSNKSRMINMDKVSDKKKKSMLDNYSKLFILDEILLLTENKYKHLKDIRYLVNLNGLLEYILPEKLYTDKVKVYYTNIILDKILEKYYDYENSKLISNLKLELLEIERCVNNKITHNIDEYYIIKITN